MPADIFLSVHNFISFTRLPCSPGVTLAFVAASSEASEEMEMNQIEIEIAGEEGEEGEEAEAVQQENEMQEEPEYTEVIYLLDLFLALLLLKISNLTSF